jgi:hypothetical protein
MLDLPDHHGRAADPGGRTCHGKPDRLRPIGRSPGAVTWERLPPLARRHGWKQLREFLFERALEHDVPSVLFRLAVERLASEQVGWSDRA